MWSGSDNELVRSEEVEVADQRLGVANVASAVSSVLPNVSNMNINSSKVHIGSKFVSVTQNVTNREVIKERAFGWSQAVGGSSKRLRCSIAVFVCWALIVTTALAGYLFTILLPTHEQIIDLDLNETWYLRREDWQALPAYGRQYLRVPLSYVVIGHSAEKFCTNRYSCIEEVMKIQEGNLKRGLDDISPNFLVGGDGFVFEGRGANVKSAMSVPNNSKSVSVMFVGDFTIAETNLAQFQHLQLLLDALVRDKVLVEDYLVHGLCQLSSYTVSPGPNVMDYLHNLTHWDPSDKSKCLRK